MKIKISVLDSIFWNIGKYWVNFSAPFGSEIRVKIGTIKAMPNISVRALKIPKNEIKKNFNLFLLFKFKNIF